MNDLRVFLPLQSAKLQFESQSMLEVGYGIDYPGTEY